VGPWEPRREQDRDEDRLSKKNSRGVPHVVIVAVSDNKGYWPVLYLL